MSWKDRASKVTSGSWRDRAQPIEAVQAEAPPQEEDVSLGQKVSDFMGAVREGIPGYGLASKAGAAFNALLDQGVDLVSDREDLSFSQHYDKWRDYQKQDDAERRERSPLLSTAGNVVGAVVAPTPGKTAVGRIAGNAGLAAADMATREDSLADATEEGLKAGALSGGLQAFFEVASPAAAKFMRSIKKASNLKEMANRRAVKAAGAKTAEYKALRHQGRLDDVGDIALSHGIVSAGDEAADIYRKSRAFVDEQGKRIGSYLDQFDDLVRAAPEEAFSAARVADRVQEEILAPLANKPAWRGVVKNLEDEVAALRKVGDGPMSFSEANALKRSYDDFLNFDKEQTPAKEMVKRIRGILNDEIEQSMNRVAKAAGIDGDVGFKEAKKLFGAGKTLEDMAEKQIVRQDANRFFSPSDYAMGIGGAVTGGLSGDGFSPLDLAKGFGLGVAHKFARERGASSFAVGLDKLSTWVAKDPAKFGKFANTLQQAASRGNKSLAITHHLLQQQDPEYRERVRKLGRDEGN